MSDLTDTLKAQLESDIMLGEQELQNKKQQLIDLEKQEIEKVVEVEKEVEQNFREKYGVSIWVVVLIVIPVIDVLNRVFHGIIK